MHAARLQMAAGNSRLPASGSRAAVFVGCSGWFYWKWRGLFYPVDLPTGEWFKHYAKCLDTIEINASFYSWPTVANVEAWKRQAGKRDFVFTVKVCELITHIKRFKGTKTLVRDFGMIADILADRMGCFLFQLPPSYRYTKARLSTILGQLDPARRNVPQDLQSMGTTMVGKPSQTPISPTATATADPSIVPKQTQPGDPTQLQPQTKSAAPPSWNEFLDKAIKRSAAQNNGKPNYTRSCQPEFKTCYDAITVVASDGKLSTVKVTKDMNDKILRREICSFNDSIDIRKCYNWDDGSAHRDMKDSNGNW